VVFVATKKSPVINVKRKPD